MYYFALFLVSAIVAVAHGQGNSMEDYININKQQHNNNLWDMHNQIMLFNETKLAGLQTIDIKLNMLVNVLEQTNRKLNSLQLLNSLSNKCINRYRHGIPPVANVTQNIKACKNDAEAQLPGLLAEPIKTINQLEAYYKSFDEAIANCQKKYNKSSQGYSMCIGKAVQNADDYTSSSKKKFVMQMNTAKGYGDALVADALTCSYANQKNVIFSDAERNLSIDNCRSGAYKCINSQTLSEYTCSEVVQIRKSDLSFNKRLIQNPFYQRSGSTNCLMLQMV